MKCGKQYQSLAKLEKALEESGMRVAVCWCSEDDGNGKDAIEQLDNLEATMKGDE